MGRSTHSNLERGNNEEAIESFKVYRRNEWYTLFRSYHAENGTIFEQWGLGLFLKIGKREIRIDLYEIPKSGLDIY